MSNQISYEDLVNNSPVEEATSPSFRHERRDGHPAAARELCITLSYAYERSAEPRCAFGIPSLITRHLKSRGSLQSESHRASIGRQ